MTLKEVIPRHLWLVDGFESASFKGSAHSLLSAQLWLQRVFVAGRPTRLRHGIIIDDQKTLVLFRAATWKPSFYQVCSARQKLSEIALQHVSPIDSIRPNSATIKYILF